MAYGKGRMKVRDIANALRQRGVDVGERKLWAMLREDGWVRKDAALPTKKALNAGYMRVESRPVTLPNGIKTVRDQLLVTPEGRFFFISRYRDR